MKPADEAPIAARLAKLMAMICVRNTRIEELHAGAVPVTHTGDYSDVFITDADGRQIPWADASHLDDDQMRNLMRQIVDRLYTFHLKADDPGFRDHLDQLACRRRPMGRAEAGRGIPFNNHRRQSSQTAEIVVGSPLRLQRMLVGHNYATGS